MVKSSVCTSMQPKSFSPIPDVPQPGATFALSSLDFLAANTEQEVVRIAVEVISKTFDPSLFYIAYSRPDADNRYTIECNTTLHEDQARPISEFLEGVLLSGIDNVSELLFDSFPILKNTSCFIAKPSSGSISRCLLLVFVHSDSYLVIFTPFVLLPHNISAQ